MKAIVTLFAAANALMLQGGLGNAAASSVGGECPAMTVTNWVMSDVNQQFPQDWTNITDGRVRFTMAAAGCAMVTFSGAANAGSDALGVSILDIQILVDDTAPCEPAFPSLSLASGGDDPPTVADSVTFICKNIAAGVHTAQAQGRNLGADVWYANVNGHTLTVTHP